MSEDAVDDEVDGGVEGHQQVGDLGQGRVLHSHDLAMEEEEVISQKLGVV